MAWWIAAAAVGSALLENESNRKGARAQSKALEASARAKLKAANSVLYASTLNRARDIEQGRQVQAKQITSFASAGVDITSGSVLDVVKSTEFNILKNDFLSKMDAEAKADQIKASADIDNQTAKTVVNNQKNAATMNLISGGLSAAKSF
jgi:hypothetical protein